MDNSQMTLPDVQDTVADSDQESMDSTDAAQTAEFQNLYELSDPEKEDALKEQNDRTIASGRYMSALYPDMIRKYKKYRSIAEPLKDSLGREIAGRSNIYVPYPWAMVESAMPRLAGKLPRVHAFPRKDIETEKVETIQDLILYSMDRMGFLKLQQQWIRQFEIYGWSPLVFFWRNEVRKVFDRTRDPLSGQFKLQRVEKQFFDDFGGMVIDVFDAFLQPGVEEVDNGDWFQFRRWLSKKYILQQVEAGIFYPEVKDYIEDNPNSVGVNRANDARGDRDSLTGLQKDFLKHTYGRYEVMYTLENERVIVSIDGKILAQIGDNPNPLQEKSVINLNLLPMVNEPIGISTIEALGGLPDKLNALSNARLDNISLLMNKVIIADRFSNTDFSNLTMSAGNIILTDNIEKSLKFLDTPSIGIESEREIGTTKQEMQFTSGISDYMAGNKDNSGTDTATGVTSIIREGNARFAMKLATFEAYPLRRLVENIHAYNMLYMPEEKRIHVLGPKGYHVRDITLDEILCECDFIIEPGSSVPLDQLTRREALVQFLDRAIQLPQVIDLNKLVREVLESLDIRNPEDLLINFNKQLPEMEDVKLAEAENIALSQGQAIELKGNDNIHIGIHSRALSEAQDPRAQASIQGHLQEHTTRQQTQLMMSQSAGQNTLFGGTQNAQSTPSGLSEAPGSNHIGSPGAQQAPPNPSPAAPGPGQAPGVGGAPGMGG